MAVVVGVDNSCLSGRPAAQSDWLGPKVGIHPVLFCIHQINRVNSCNGRAVMTAAPHKKGLIN